MANESNLKPFTKGEDPRRNLEGRPEGIKNRSTIAKQVLGMKAILPEEMMLKLKETYPEIGDKLTAEEIATIVMVGNAISKGDVNAYKAVMDSAYGAPKGEIEHSGGINLHFDSQDSQIGSDVSKD